MKQIMLVFTAHTEIGLCNENELLKILRSIGPDVIFEEIRAIDADLYYRERSRSTVETRAISKYLDEIPARQVLVDDYEFTGDFGRKIISIDRLVTTRVEEYRVALHAIDEMKSEYGFRYLNSQYFVDDNEKAERIYEAAVEKHGDDEIKAIITQRNRQVRIREVAMLDGIYAFSRNNSFERGVFMVGAGHTTPIMSSINSRAEGEATAISWTFWNRGGY